MTIVLSREGIVPSGLPLTCSSTHRGSRAGAGNGGISAGARNGPSGSRYRRAVNSVAGAGSSLLGGHPFASADPPASGSAAGRRDIKHRFEITGKLGSGTYGKVSLAFDHKTEREVAVKLIRKSAIENKQDLVRIRREIRIMSMLNHPNIIQIYEVFENKDKIILVMEYASGGELYDYVSKNGSLPEAEARRIFRQITSAVLYCHKNKVAHRDLKLENILLDARNNAKIADFGLSNYFGQKHKLLLTFCGSPLYASPEIINGTPYKGPEVDCWSLGILLYTLVYGSMPFDGRDFNRMVRQIKRGAYYEPDTPSTASMLIRNMLRVNPERRATIYDIASHWWLNLEENMPIIQELPENQITDPTPLNERAEIMVVQELADETDVFMEFGHLSQATRRKIEEFRRRRKEAEEYNEQSPIKPPKARRTSKDEQQPEMSAQEKMLRQVVAPAPIAEGTKSAAPVEAEKSAFHDPLERLKQLESRLQTGAGQAKRASPGPSAEAKSEEEGATKAKVAKEEVVKQEQQEPKKKRKPSLKRQESVKQQQEKEKSAKKSAAVEQAIVTPVKAEPPAAARAAAVPSAETQLQYWRLETDSLNALMNQVLEQMERGPVSINLVARIKAHPFYDERPEVKELLESIIAAQPVEVQKQTSKLIQQQSKQMSNKALVETPKRKTSSSTTGGSTAAIKQNSLRDSVKKRRARLEKTATAEATEETAATEAPTATEAAATTQPPVPPATEQRRAQWRQRKAQAEERRWHSVEVGFSTEDSSSTEETPATGATVAADAAMEAVSATGAVAAPRFVGIERVTRSEPWGDEYDEEFEEEDFGDEDEEEEEEIDELAEVVEQIAGGDEAATGEEVAAPRIVATAPASAPLSPLATTTATTSNSQDVKQHLLNALAKRVSKGKYQFLAHQSVEMYGRGVSAEAESPPPARKKIGGPQPRPEHSPILFDKAKHYLMAYPDTGDEEEEEGGAEQARRRKSKSEGESEAADKQTKQTQQQWLKSQDPDMAEENSVCSSAGGGEVTEKEKRQSAERQTVKGNDERTFQNGRRKKKQSTTTEEESEEEEEEEEEDSAPFRPRPSTIIGFRTIQPAGVDGVPKEAPIVQVKPQNSQPQSPVQASTPALATSAPPIQSAATQQRPKLLAKNSINATVPYRRSPVVEEARDSPTPPDPTVTQTPPQPNDVRRYESAAAYIRRKNRERRARNLTVAITELPPREEDPWTTRFPSLDQPYYQPSSPTGFGASRRKSSFGAQKLDNSAMGMDNGGWRRSAGGAENSNYARQTYVDRRKSVHEQSPPSSDDQLPYDRYAIAGGYFNALVGNAHMPSNISRYEDEVINAFKQYGGGAGAAAVRGQDKERFEVYKTMAERAAEFGRNDMSAHQLRMASGGSCYYPGERPLSSYAGGQLLRHPVPPPPGGGYGAGAVPAQQQPQAGYDRRRSVYDMDRPNIGNDYGSGSGFGYANGGAGYIPEPESPPSGGGRFRHRRIAQALRDAEGRRAQYASRSQSNDHLFMLSGGGGRPFDDYDPSPYTAGGYDAQRYMTQPDGGYGGYADRGGPMAPPDYAYVAYHDSGTYRPGLGAIGRQEPLDLNAVPARSILKNRQAYEVEPRGPPMGAGGPAQAGLMGRLRRLASVEKSYGLGGGCGDDASGMPDAYAQQRFGGPSGRRYGGSSDHLPGMMLGSMVPPSYQQQQQPPMMPYGMYEHGHGAGGGGGYDPYALDSAPSANPTSTGRKRGEGSSLWNRRRTTEVRLQPEGGAQSGSIKSRDSLLDEEYKRPRSPIDRIKSLFQRGSSKHKESGSGAGSSAANNNAPPYSTTIASGATRFSSAIGGGVGTGGYAGSGPSGYAGGISGYKRYGIGPTSGGGGTGITSSYGTTGANGYGSRYGSGGYGRPAGGRYDTDTHL